MDEKGHNLFCWDWLLACSPCFNFWCHWCLRKYITLCLNVITFCFSTESFCIFFSVLSPWINTWSGGYLCLLTNILCSFLLRVLLHFILFYFLSIFFSSHGVRTRALVFGYMLRNDVSGDMRSELCSNQWIVEIGGSVLLASDLAFLTLWDSMARTESQLQRLFSSITK